MECRVCVIAVHAQQNATLKSYYQKREHFGRYMTEGSSNHMFAETGTTSQVEIINHHQEKTGARPGTLRLPLPWRQPPRSSKMCVYQDVKILIFLFSTYKMNPLHVLSASANKRKMKEKQGKQRRIIISRWMCRWNKVI